MLWSTLSLLSVLVAASATPSSTFRPRPLVALVPHGTSPAFSAQYLSTVGVATLSDVYYLDEVDAFDSDSFDDTTRIVQLDQPLDQLRAHEGQGRAPPRLVWIHVPKLVESDPRSFTPETDVSLTSTSQHAFSAPRPALPTRLVSLPSDGRADEGAIHLLSPDSAVALEQLEFLTSHPSTALLTLVSIPSPRSNSELRSDTLADQDGPRFPRVPKRDVERVENWLHSLEFEPLLSVLLDDLKVKRIVQDVNTLSGEDQSHLREDQRWVSRHSMSTGAITASHWLLTQMRSYDFTCTTHSFLEGFSPMLECVYNRSGKSLSVSNETVVLGAHYDSRGSFGFPTAPGADDDASGTSLVLAVARHIHLNRLVFSRKLVLALFAGEEQGLLGSSWYANYLKEHLKEDVVWMLQVDMVGYRAENEPPQLALPDVIGLPQAAYLVGNISNRYVPELVVGRTGACCSDHQSFVQNGIASTWIFERNGPIADPCYHSSCDLSERKGYDFGQILMHTKVAFSTMWLVGGGRVE